MMRFPELRTHGSAAVSAFAVVMLFTLGAPGRAAAQEGQNGQIHVQKACPATTFTGAPGSYCTITVSNLADIPANATRVYYDEPVPLPIGTLAFLDSTVVVYVGPGNWAVGRCTVDYSTGLGLCTVSDGSGVLAGFSARVDVRIDYSSGITYWDGTYSFRSLPAR